MKILNFPLLLTACLLVFSHLATQASANEQFEITHTLTVELSLEDRQLKATDHLTRSDPKNPWPLFWHLAPQATDIQATADGQPLTHQFIDGKLSLPELLATTEVLTLSWQAHFADPIPEQTVGIEDPSYGVRATIHEKGVFLSAQSDWLPSAAGYPATSRLTVIGPRGLIAVSNGLLLGIEHKGVHTVSHWHNRTPQTRQALSAGFLELSQTEHNNTQLVILFSKENQSLALSYLEATRQYLDLYTELLGPYPYDKFAVVENFYPTGYGLPGWTLIGNRVLRLPFILTSSLPHEIVHAWWGNSVGVDYGSGNWCEGLTTYLADYLLKELSNPNEAREYRLKILRDYASLVNSGNDFPLRDFHSRHNKVEQAIGYGKAAMVFHMLRQKIGDQPFWLGLRQLARDFSGETASWSDLQNIFEKSSGEKLGNFFEQWIDRKEAPQLSLQETLHYQLNSNWVIEGKIIQQPPPYQLEIPLQIQTEQGNSRQVIEVEAGETPFRLETP
ncbi:MAG: peptidase M1, partial [Desulfuromonas sp.]